MAEESVSGALLKDVAFCRARIVEDLAGPFDFARFNLRRMPLIIGKIDEQVLLSPKPNVQEMPIKLPGGEIQLPFGKGIEEIVALAVEHEKGINPDFDAHYAYLTMNQGEVVAGKSQRNAGAHFDGMQGSRYPVKVSPCHSYLISSALPTLYYEGPFDFSKLDPARHNFFTECERQKGAPVPIPTFHLCMQTAYQVHESPIARENQDRTFMRIHFSRLRDNRQGSTLNPLIDTSSWNYEPRPIPAHLI